MAIRINVPTDEKTIRSLRAGDEVLLNGILVTARDAAHKLLITKEQKDLKPLLKNMILYHCGPIVKQVKGKWEIVVAGPTTSIREEAFEAEVMKKYGIRGAIGKGGMGKKTLDACKKYGAVYFHTTGGAAAEIARTMVEVVDVKHLEMGTPEAFWVIKVVDFPAIVTMDSHGVSLHEKVDKESKAMCEKLTGGMC